VAAVGAEEPLREVWSAEVLQVHGEEGHVGEDIAVAKPVVELHAVEDPWAVGQTEDVLGPQVAVAVTGVSVGDAAGEKPRPAGEVAAGELLYLLGQHRVEAVAEEREHLREVRLPVGGHPVAACGGVHLGRAPGLAVEAGDRRGHLVDLPLERFSTRGECGEAALGGHEAHDDGGLLLVAIVKERQAQIDVGAEPAVQLELSLAHATAQGRRGEVLERQSHGLFELIHALAEGDHDGDVGSKDGHLSTPVQPCDGLGQPASSKPCRARGPTVGRISRQAARRGGTCSRGPVPSTAGLGASPAQAEWGEGRLILTMGQGGRPKAGSRGDA
jgi:hypothetical protein